MTAEQIYELARKRQHAPDSLTLPELCLYTTARNIYKSYQDGIITLEQAKSEKQKSINGFERMNMRYEVYGDHARRRVKISQLLTEADKNGCEICKYDINQHGELGWWYPTDSADPNPYKYTAKNGTTYAWTRGMPSRPFMYETAQMLRASVVPVARSVFQ
ncbi:MAG: hypothetical protein ACI4RK_04810 [Oscillospiraceae bacterium]